MHAEQVCYGDSRLPLLLMPIPDPVFEHFAADPGGPLLHLPYEAANADSPVRAKIEEFLSSIDAGRVATVRQDHTFQHLTSGIADLDREARIWAGVEMLTHAIAARRLEVLRQDSTSDRPRPYGEPALADLTPDAEHLVPLCEFEFDGCRLVRNGHAFLMLSTTGSPNSSYWLLQSCYSEGLHEHVRVRLDPFLHGSAESFRAMFYAMLVYGQPLDWNRIDGLHTTDHGRWCPAASNASSKFTDYAWTPRRSEVHFVCEEVPTAGMSIRRGGRYLHAIYVPSEAAVSHLDAGVRIYSDSEVRDRHNRHVRQAGKVGLRQKVLRIDQPVPRTVLAPMCQAFFVWNGDVRQYFEDGCTRGGATVGSTS